GEGLDFEDLLQAGRMGVERARQKWQPDGGSSFATVASWWIRAFIADEATRNGRTVREPRGIHNARSRARDGFPERTLRLDLPVAAGMGSMLDTMLDPSPSPSAELEAKQVRERVRAAIETLPPRLREIVRLRHYE